MDTRKDDLEILKRAARSGDPLVRKVANEAGRKIAGETRAIRHMRARLAAEMRKGNTENVKDIHEDIKKREKYQNE